MGPARIREEARLRLANTEYLRRRLFLSLAQQMRIGKITPNEAAAIRRQFWEDRRADALIVRGGVDARTRECRTLTTPTRRSIRGKAKPKY